VTCFAAATLFVARAGGFRGNFRFADGPEVGRMRAEHLPELEKQIRESESKIVLDLEEVNLVDTGSAKNEIENSRCYVFVRLHPTPPHFRISQARIHFDVHFPP
jgi:hypothetical protein